MSKQYETGHAKNVANFQKLIEQITAFSKYNPPIHILKTENLITLYNQALDLINQVEEQRIVNKNAIHTRQHTYVNLRPTITKIINYLEILDLPQGTLAQARSFTKTIRGEQNKKKANTSQTQEENNTISTSRQSYTQLAENFSKFLQLLAILPIYTPNEEALQLENLKTYHTQLVNATTAVNQTEATFNTKLIERDKLLYVENTGLYAITQKVKKYIKSLYGSSSPEYSKISKIKFTSK